MRGASVFAVERETRARRLCATVDGYTLHAGVQLRAPDREGLEKLCRYGARPAFSLARMSLREDGRVEYRTRKRLRDGSQVLLLEPDALLGRLAALIPPPRANLVRYHGVLAPASRLRARVVPAAPTRETAAAPARPARNDRLPWATLLKKVYREDALRCRDCGGKARVLAMIMDPEVVRRILRHLGLRERPLGLAPAREPELPPFGELEAVEVEQPAWSDLDWAVEPAEVRALPRWMRARPAGSRRRQRDAEHVDEPVCMERLPAWMRSPRAREPRRPRWEVRPAPDERADDAWPDESPVMEVLPLWMRRGTLGRPAPPVSTDAIDWDLVDPPAPDTYVDPQYDDAAYFQS